jgi:hypothetical protein
MLPPLSVKGGFGNNCTYRRLKAGRVSNPILAAFNIRHCLLYSFDIESEHTLASPPSAPRVISDLSSSWALDADPPTTITTATREQLRRGSDGPISSANLWGIVHRNRSLPGIPARSPPRTHGHSYISPSPSLSRSSALQHCPAASSETAEQPQPILSTQHGCDICEPYCLAPGWCPVSQPCSPDLPSAQSFLCLLPKG